MGVFLTIENSDFSKFRLPHVRGGVSGKRILRMIPIKSSPRAWGCFLAKAFIDRLSNVFPTCVGVFLHRPQDPRPQVVFPTCVGVFPGIPSAMPAVSCLPHVRGGVSFHSEEIATLAWSSPRAWGCFAVNPTAILACPVFPTCVGVFLLNSLPERAFACLPHVRGGVSVLVPVDRDFAVSSPRAWGCFSSRISGNAERIVFPTCVGVFLRQDVPMQH